MMEEIRRVMPHIKDSDMEELGEQALGKLQNMTDEEFAEISLEAAEWMWVGMNTLEVLTLLLVVFAALTYIDNKHNRK